MNKKAKYYLYVEEIFDFGTAKTVFKTVMETPFLTASGIGDLTAIYDQYRKKANYKANFKPSETKLAAVTQKRSAWKPGEYWAHEYQKPAAGRQRVLTYSNGFQEYETQCLNRNFLVMDGIWQCPNGNGSGDTFETY